MSESDHIARGHLEAAVKSLEWRLQQAFQVIDSYKEWVERLERDAEVFAHLRNTEGGSDGN